MSNLQCLITSLHILLIVFLFFFVKQRLLIKVMKLGRPAWHFTSGFSNFVFSLISISTWSVRFDWFGACGIFCVVFVGLDIRFAHY